MSQENEYEQYDFEFADHNHNSSDDDNDVNSENDDNDYDEDGSFSFTGLGGKRKRRGKGQGYTTFDNDPKPKKSSQQRREESLYGVFAESSYSNNSKWTKADITKEVSFVKATTKIEQPPEKQDKNMDEVVLDHQGKAGPTKKAEALDDANAKFMSLLNRGKGENKSNQKNNLSKIVNETQFDNANQSELSGIGFHSSHTNNNDIEEISPGIGLGFNNEKETHRDNPPSMNDFFNSSSYSDKNVNSNTFTTMENALYKQKLQPKIDPNIGKWEKHTKGIGMKLLTKMGFSGSGGLGKRNRKSITTNQIVESMDETSINQNNTNHGSGAGIGISKPVEVVVRPANLGLGFGNFKEASRLKTNRQLEAEVRGTKFVDSDDDDNSKKKKSKRSASIEALLPSTDKILQNAAWKKKKKKNEKQPYKFVSYHEIIKADEKKEGMKIIDMRGPQSIPTADPNVSDQTNRTIHLGEEVLHNVSLLVNAYESRLQMSQHMHISNQQKIKSVQQNIATLEVNIDERQSRINRMKQIQDLLQNIENLVENYDAETKSFSESLPPLLSKIRGTFSPEEQQSLHLNDILLPALLGPALDRYIKKWKPLDEPDFIVSALQFWRPVLSGIDSYETRESDIDTSHEIFASKDRIEIEKIKVLRSTNDLMFRHFITKIRQVVLSKWNAYDANKCIALYKVLLAAANTCEVELRINIDEDVLIETSSTHVSVQKLVKDFVIDTIVPKLIGALSEWMPSHQQVDDEDVESPQKWMFPWLPFFGETIKANLFKDIQRKLKTLLSRCASAISYHLTSRTSSKEYPNTEMLHSILSPWRKILPITTIYSLMSKHVLPSLSQVLSSFEINPSNQNLSIIYLIQKFNEAKLFPPHTLSSLFEGQFCLNWTKTLYSWLFCPNSSKGRNYQLMGTVLEEVAQFYLGWKQILLVDLSLSRDDVIVRYFYVGLQMIDLAIKKRQGADDVMSQEEMDSTIDELEPPGCETSNYQMALRKRQRESQIKEQATQDLEYQTKTMKTNMFNSQNMVRSKFIRRSVDMTSFREVIEDFAMENDILLVPRREGIDANARKDGKQVYNFGKIPIYIDENVVFAQLKRDGNNVEGLMWDPTSLDDLAAISKEL